MRTWWPNSYGWFPTWLAILDTKDVIVFLERRNSTASDTTNKWRRQSSFLSPGSLTSHQNPQDPCIDINNITHCRPSDNPNFFPWTHQSIQTYMDDDDIQSKLCSRRPPLIPHVVIDTLTFTTAADHSGVNRFFKRLSSSDPQASALLRATTSLQAASKQRAKILKAKALAFHWRSFLKQSSRNDGRILLHTKTTKYQHFRPPPPSSRQPSRGCFRPSRWP